MVSSLLLGGGTRGGFLSDTILELIAIPSFLLSLSSLVALPWSDSKRRAEWPLLLCLAIAILPLIQLVPLPPWLWTRLPHREEIVTVFDLLGRSLPWWPISVSPSATWVSVLSLLPPIAVFLGVIQLSYRERRSFSVIVIGLGVVAAFVGVLQVAQGPSSPLRFFAITSDVEAVGFFANTNHFAALMYTLAVFVAAWLTDMAFAIGPWKDRKNLESTSIATLTGVFLILIVFIAADAMTRSRAGLGLMIVALFATIALPMMDRRRSSGVTRIKLIAGAGLLVLFLVVQFGLYRISQRIAVDPLQDARIAFARNTITAAKAYMPFGSGFGTFVTVYPTFEPPQDTIANVFANHAHNDWLEIWLEGGIVSVILVVGFLIWFLLRSAKIWGRAQSSIRPIDLLLARAATIAIPLILVHSIVDYPLRTDAMMAIFAFSCALLIEPLAPAQNERALQHSFSTTASEDDAPRLATPKTLTSGDRPGPMAERPSPKPAERWGEDIEWPDKWRK
jgi:O-antigen ligase